ncbi:hypothetical protein B0H16DRAFT_1477705 [Mycena metata]|uniref:Uncharacterized protein n=1 Tax=Mycena metata TaxID=1033252 RepID=A0AAD7H8G4_9AGAR|nr:hypothetical protein B0H16DRAFT_1477705 [Mycena metata]
MSFQGTQHSPNNVFYTQNPWGPEHPPLGPFYVPPQPQPTQPPPQQQQQQQQTPHQHQQQNGQHPNGPPPRPQAPNGPGQHGPPPMARPRHQQRYAPPPHFQQPPVPPPNFHGAAPQQPPPPAWQTPPYFSSAGSFHPMYNAPPHFAPGMHSSVSGHIASIGPVPKPFSLSTTQWAETDKLALERGNWQKWSTKVRLDLMMQPGAARFLNDDDDPNPCPSFEMFPGHHRAWKDSDAVVRAFITSICTMSERGFFAKSNTAAEIWASLRARHERCGPIGQIRAMRKFVSCKFSSDPSTFASKLQEMTDLNEAIWAAGTVDPDSFLLAGLLAALHRENRAFVDSVIALPNLNLSILLDRLNELQRIDGTDDNNNTAYATQGRPRQDRPPRYALVAVLHHRGRRHGREIYSRGAA